MPVLGFCYAYTSEIFLCVNIHPRFIIFPEGELFGGGYYLRLLGCGCHTPVKGGKHFKLRYLGYCDFAWVALRGDIGAGGIKTKCS